MGLKAGYKQTEVGAIPEDWEVKPLGVVVTFLDGKRRPVKDSDRAKMRGAYPYYGASGIVDYVNDFLFDDELILLGEDGENILSRNCRLAFRVSGKIWVNNHAHVLKPASEVSIGFLADFLESVNYERFNSGTAQPKLNKQTCSNISVALPQTKAEQESIAEALSDADALIESLEQLLAKKRNLKQGAMQELLTGKRRMSGFERTSGYKLTEIGLIPNDWDVCQLGEGIKLVSGQHVLAEYCNTEGQGVAYITGPADFPDGSIDHTKWTTRPGTICNKGDILITVKGSGAGTLVLSDAEYCISRQLMAIGVLKWNPSFIYYFLLREESLFGMAATGLIPGLSRSDLLNKMVPIPPTRDEQTAIAEVLSDMGVNAG